MGGQRCGRCRRACVFGDMAELMQPVADRGVKRYLDEKRWAPKADDPVADLWAGRDPHVALAVAQAVVDKSLHSRGDKGPRSAAELLVLRNWLNRLAAADRTEGPWR